MWHGDAAGLTVELLWSFSFAGDAAQTGEWPMQADARWDAPRIQQMFRLETPHFCARKKTAAVRLSAVQIFSSWRFIRFAFFVFFFVCGISEVLSSWRLVIKFKR